MARICNNFSQSLLSVRDLRIETTQKSSDRDWFRGAGRFHVAGEQTADILHAIRPCVGDLQAVRYLL